MPDEAPILEAVGLQKHYPVQRGLGLLRVNRWVRAVDGIDFRVPRGRTLGIVGESGCGKSTTGRLLLRLEEPSVGEVRFDGIPLNRLEGMAARHYRRSVQAIFQDPYSSLSPRLRVRDIVAEPLVVNEKLGRAEVRERVSELLSLTGLGAFAATQYPYEFSGGQRQRIAIARALALHPAVIVLDEPVSSLDVSIRAQIINLLRDLQDRFSLTYVLISHDFSVVEFMSDAVVVMYLGKIVESSPGAALWRRPLHPYTQALISAATPGEIGQRRRVVTKGDVPSPVNIPTGCRFHPRCPIAIDRCKTEVPELRLLETGHQVACHRADEQPS